MIKGNALYAQSGGVTAVINVSAAALIESIRPHVDRVYAAQNGILGVLRERLLDVTDIDTQALSNTPGGAFGSCRFKLGSPDDRPEQYQRLLDVFLAHNIRYFFYNGGNDSADTALKVSQLAADRGVDLQCIAIPKTVDNDLVVTDNCPGFGSVAKYVAVSLLEAALDVSAMAETSTKVFVMETMGRHAGWIAAAAGLIADQHPVVILFPEIPFDSKAFLGQVKRHVESHGYCVVAVSEGLKDVDGKFFSASDRTDAFGHHQLGGVAPRIAELITGELGYKHHWAVLDYLQRSARHIASATDLEHARAVAEKAAELAVAGRNAVMPAIRRSSNDPYQWSVEGAHLADIANAEKKMPAEFIGADGMSITAECREYLLPLIQGEAYPTYQGGLPDYRQFDLPSVDQELSSYEPSL